MQRELTKTAVAEQRELCAACKSRPAERAYVGAAEGVEHLVRVCAECYDLLIRTPIERRAS